MRYAALLLVLVLAACGGGGAGVTPTPNPTPDPSPTPTPTPLAANAVAVIIEPGPGSNVNVPYVSVKVCAPGTSTCQTIDHVLVDTGSFGLRLLASNVTALALPAQTDSSGSAVLSCGQFVNFVTWGPVKLADVTIGSKRVGALPIQAVADPKYPSIPVSCGSARSAATTASALGANGILGVGVRTNDDQQYYNCVSGARFHSIDPCMINLAAAKQVQNPVALFASDNNGVVLQFPAVPSTGADRLDGVMLFGIDTQDNNRLGAAKVVPTDASGYFTTTYKGTALRQSFMDSGSNGLFFADASLSPCSSVDSGFYCPSPTQNLTASIALQGGASGSVNFAIADAAALLFSTGYVFNNLGGSMTGASFDWGLPFFLGRSVYTVIEGRSTSAGVGPMYAYTN